MVSAQPAPEVETIFTVLARAARLGSRRRLAVQLVLTLAAALTVPLVAPQWWSVAALLMAPAAFAAWGLVMHLNDGHGPRHSLVPATIAAAGTAAALVGSVGLALALFSGTAKGTYSPCGAGATSPMCRAWADPPPASGKAIR